MSRVSYGSTVATTVRRATFRYRIALAIITTVAGVAALGAAARNSTTYDEIVLIAGGARGWSNGGWDIAVDHPPMMLYLYGLPAIVDKPTIPSIDLPPVWRTRDVLPGDSEFLLPRYTFAQTFLWGSGNDPVAATFYARLPAIAFLIGLISLTFVFTRTRWGQPAAVFAAGMVAFLPDTLAHGSIAYFDIPLCFAIVIALAAMERAVRDPTPVRGVLFGLALAFALSIKFTAILLLPAAIVVTACEAAARYKDMEWWRKWAIAGTISIAVLYLALVVVYRGDVLLRELRFGVAFTSRLGSAGHPFYSLLLGKYYETPPWFAYPVLEFFKTPVAFHMLVGSALIGYIGRVRKSSLHELCRSPLRAPIAMMALVAASLLWSNGQLASRYALPFMILLCMVTAVGIDHLWQRCVPAARGLLVALLVWMAAGTLSFYPGFLAYTNEWGPGRDQGWKLFSSSNLDWGQGLLELRRWMVENEQEYVYLAYFGSGSPAGYGIRYVPLEHGAALPDAWPAPNERPRYAVISSHFMIPNAMGDDPFREFRTREPVVTLGNVLAVFRVGTDNR